MAAPKENKNAEKWNEDESIELFNKAIELSLDESKAFDFIGEVARELGTYRDLFTYLNNKFISCNRLHNILISNLESNCFSHVKRGDINTAAGIINLKSNHGWTDRVDNTTKGEVINSDKPIEITFK